MICGSKNFTTLQKWRETTFVLLKVFWTFFLTNPFLLNRVRVFACECWVLCIVIRFFIEQYDRIWMGLASVYGHSRFSLTSIGIFCNNSNTYASFIMLNLLNKNTKNICGAAYIYITYIYVYDIFRNKEYIFLRYS